jgi:hypothetical protein
MDPRGDGEEGIVMGIKEETSYIVRYLIGNVFYYTLPMTKIGAEAWLDGNAATLPNLQVFKAISVIRSGFKIKEQQ